jgi:hypothetical protein
MISNDECYGYSEYLNHTEYRSSLTVTSTMMMYNGCIMWYIIILSLFIRYTYTNNEYDVDSLLVCKKWKILTDTILCVVEVRICNDMNEYYSLIPVDDDLCYS